ncbi:MAG: T9SS type A sorting domain-containing protein [Chitinispirillales bacterium]|jgi:hypothetical protein|nr:T9SS type A sorting domain-containing protein [Chitinispirillales bacterium]
MKKQIFAVVSIIVLIVSVPVLAQKYNFDVENVGQNCNAAYKGLLATADPALPDPFAMHDGTRITDKSEWACRRNEVKKDLEQYEIGPKPAPSTATVRATYSGSTLTVTITTKDGSINLTSTVSGSGNCVAIGMNGNAGNISGCKQIPFKHDQVVAYSMSSDSHNKNDPFYKVYPDLYGKIGKYAAWSWGISRLIDGIVLVKDQLGVDVSKIGLQGCSYAGKMALFGGALDERVTLTVVQESGGGGINSWRYSKAFTARTGTNIEKIDNTSGIWFLQSMKSQNPDKLPYDHHQLIAMIAPRATIILGNPPYEWLGDESGYKSTIAARKVWQAFGLTDYIGFDFAGGHEHCQAASSQTTNVNAFVNRFLKGQNVNTKIEANRPTVSTFVLDTTVAWSVPTLTGTYGGSPTPVDYVPTATAKSNMGLKVTAISKSALNVSFNAKNSGAVAINLYSLKGNLISSAKIQTVAGANYSHSFNASKMPTGFYLVKVSGSGFAEQARVVVP